MICPSCGAILTTSRRTIEQSRTLHKIIRAYSDATGEPFELVKLKWKFFIGAYVAVPLDITTWKPPEWAGQFVTTSEVQIYHHKQIPVITFLKSEAAYSKDEEARLLKHAIDECERVDADLSWLEG